MATWTKVKTEEDKSREGKKGWIQTSVWISVLAFKHSTNIYLISTTCQTQREVTTLNSRVRHICNFSKVGSMIGKYKVLWESREN